MVFKLFWAAVFGALFTLIYVVVAAVACLAPQVSPIVPLAGTWGVGLAVGDIAAVDITVQAPVGPPAAPLPLTHLMPATMTP